MPCEDAEHTYESLILSFEYFGGVTAEVLVDNQKAEVIHHRRGAAVEFNPRFLELVWAVMEMPLRVRADFALERELWSRGVTAVAGVDEVGVGALAGSVIAAAVILAPGTIINGLADSKLLTAKRREELFVVIAECAVAIGLGRSEVDQVDRINVYWAAMEARRRALEALQVTSGHVLVDGKRRIMGCRLSQTPVVGGDALCGSIAAA